MITWPEIPADEAPAAAPQPRGFTHRRPPVSPSLRPGHNLPDGRPLLLTMSRKCLFVRLTQKLSVAQPEDAMLLLYLCSPDFDPDTVWQTPEPNGEDTETPLSTEAPDIFTALRLTAQHWSESLDHTQMIPLWDLAIALWNGQHATATTVIADGEAGEKKSPPASSPTGLNNTSGFSPAGTSLADTTFSTGSPSATPTPASTRGTSSKASPASPRKSARAASRPRKRA